MGCVKQIAVCFCICQVINHLADHHIVITSIYRATHTLQQQVSVTALHDSVSEFTFYTPTKVLQHIELIRMLCRRLAKYFE